MPKLKIQNRFGITPNSLLNNPEISWKAKGLYGYLQSKPDDWDFAVNRIQQDAKDGRDGTNNGLKELEDAGYLMRSKFKNEKGQWDIEYTLFDQPTFNIQEDLQDKTTTENPSRLKEETTTDFPSTDFPSTENTETNKKRNTKKEIQKKNIYIEDPKINEKILEWMEDRKERKKEMTERAVILLVNKCKVWLQKYSSDRVCDFFDRAMLAGWTGVFELKEDVKPQKTKVSHAYEGENARSEFSF